jgi:hypothetical protein
MITVLLVYQFYPNNGMGSQMWVTPDPSTLRKLIKEFPELTHSYSFSYMFDGCEGPSN